MNRALSRIPCVLALSTALAVIPQSSFAQHGGHGGGGFHGGGFGHGGFGGGGFGSHGGFHGGGFAGRGGDFQGFRGNGGWGGFHNGGGFGGFRNGRGFGGFGGGRGFNGFGNGFGGGFRRFHPYGYGLSFDFGFFPFWPSPYFYGYSPWWVAPYPDPYYYPYDYYDPYADPGYGERRNYRCRPDYRYDNRCNDSPDNSRPNRENRPAQPSNGTLPEGSTDQNYVTNNSGELTATSAVTRTVRIAYSDALQIPQEARPAVRNAIEALRAMPPDARERQLNSGHYANFSSEERGLLKNAVSRSTIE